MSASPTIGAATCRSIAACTISTASASSSTATGRPRSKPSRKATSSSARSSPRAPGRPATTFRRSTPARWSSANFPARSGRPCRRSALNQRRERFRDPRVRRAIALCFDFEWTNRNLFYGAYERSQSCFERSDFKAEGLPVARGTGAARAAARQAARRGLRRGGDCSQAPTARGRDRKLLGAGVEAAAEAGWKRQGSLLVNDKGETLDARNPGRRRELRARPLALGREHAGDRHRRLDPAWSNSAQYQARQADFDFDLISMALLVSRDADARRHGRHLPFARRQPCQARATCRAPRTRRSTR